MREALLHLMVLTLFVEGVGVGPVTSGRVVLVLAVLAVVFTVAADRTTPVVPHPWVGFPAALLFLLVLVSGTWAGSRAAWLENVLELALALGFFVAYSVLLASRAVLRRLLTSFVVGAVLVAPVGLVQALQAERAVGLQGDPNTYALYQLAAVPIVVFLVVRSRGLARFTWTLVGVLLVASVLAAQSRGAGVGLMAVTLWLLWDGAGARMTPARRIAQVAAGGAVLTAGALAVISWLPRFDPVGTLEGGGTGRLDIWRSALRGWREQPFLGLGAGNYEAESGRLLSQTPGVQLDPYSVLFDGIKVHNVHLEPLVELGPAGLLAWLALLAGTALVLVRDRRRHPTDLIGATLPMLLAFVTAATFLSATNNKLLWTLVGFAAVLPYVAEKPEQPSPDPARDLEPAGGLQ